MESARVRDFHTSWWSIWYRTSERSERVRFLILHQRVWRSRTKRFPCCNLFILYILRFSHPQKYILALDKFELRTTRVHQNYYLVKAVRQSDPRWPRKSPRKHNSLKPWFVIGRNDFFTCEKLVSSLWLVEVKSETLFHTAKFDAKILVCIKQVAIIKLIRIVQNSISNYIMLTSSSRSRWYRKRRFLVRPLRGDVALSIFRRSEERTLLNIFWLTVKWSLSL